MIKHPILRPKNKKEISSAFFNYDGVDKDFFNNLYEKDNELFSMVLEVKSEINMYFSVEYVINTLKNGDRVGPFTIRKHCDLMLYLLHVLMPLYTFGVIQDSSQAYMRVNMDYMEETIYYIRINGRRF